MKSEEGMVTSVSSLMWMPGTELGSSRRAASTLHTRDISPDPGELVLNDACVLSKPDGEGVLVQQLTGGDEDRRGQGEPNAVDKGGRDSQAACLPPQRGQLGNTHRGGWQKLLVSLKTFTSLKGFR